MPLVAILEKLKTPTPASGPRSRMGKPHWSDTATQAPPSARFGVPAACAPTCP
jgi:hypothetical protein